MSENHRENIVRELNAMNRICHAIQELTLAERRRCLQWAWEALVLAQDAPAPEPVAWEYYYKTKGCSAKNAHDPDCICWHKEGTGPYDNERHDSTSSPVIWRLLTSPHQQQVVEP